MAATHFAVVKAGAVIGSRSSTSQHDAVVALERMAS